jgi:hypothetical protein
MPRISLAQLAYPVSTVVLLAAAACGSGQTAIYPNYVDTLTMYALNGTPIRTPSAYSMLDLAMVGTDTTGAFDFAFDIDSAGRPVIYPSGVLGLSPTPGLQQTSTPFANLHTAPTDGYVADSALPLDTGSVFLARSRSATLSCLYLSVPRYGKFHVLAIDKTQRTMTLEGLVDLNCGYHNLDPGLPGS